jgi:hypothetical protein
VASFGARGGYWCTILPDWCKPGARVGLGRFLCIGWPVHGKKKVLENHLFHVKNPLLGENSVLRNHFLGLGNFDETS